MGLAAAGGNQHSADSPLLSRTILAFDRIDAFITTAVACIQMDKNASMERHRKSVYREPIRSDFPKTFQKTVGQVFTCVQNKCSGDLKFSFFDLPGSSLKLSGTA